MRKILLLGLFVSTPIFADYTCIGKINNINQGRKGTISIISPDMFGDSYGRKICSLTEIWKGVNPEACKGWLSKLLVAKTSNKKLFVQYVDATSCKSQPSWSAANAPWAIWEAE